MKIAILTSKNQWFVPYAEQLANELPDADLFFDHAKIDSGYDTVFMLAYHQIVPLNKIDGNFGKADVVGPICETGDFLAKERMLPDIKRGDYLAVMTAGAYGYSLASNYNSRARAAEIWVDENKDELIREREKVEDWV